MVNKKGALELSINTIIIIVIGVTLLTLGLLFVRGIFGKMDKISENTFNNANDLLGGLENVKSLLTVSPTQIEIEQGKDDVAKVIIANFNTDGTDLNVGIKVTPRSSDKNLKCYVIGETNAEPSQELGSFKISSGNQKNIALIVQDLNGAIRNTACTVSITGAPEGEDNSETVVINVKAKEKAFG